MTDLKYIFPNINYKFISKLVFSVFFAFLLIITLIPINITSKGDGRTIVSNAIHTMQATEQATILKMHIKENQHVKKGDLLIELNAKLSENELKNLEHTKNMLLLTNERIIALLEKRKPNFQRISEDNLLIQSASNIYEQEKNTFLSKQTSIINQIKAKHEEENTLKESIRLFQKLANTAKDYLDRLVKLINKKVLAEMDKYDIQKQYIDASSNLQMQKTTLESAKNMRIAYEKELETVKFDFERTNRLQLEENIKNIDILEKDINNIKERIRKMKIYANADGTIFNVAAHENSVVSASQVIAQLVPNDEAIEVEVVMNKANCGLIEIGNEAIIKLQAFPYQIYGTIKGTVKSLAPVSSNDMTKQCGINVRIKLKSQEIKTEKNSVALRPLMPLEAAVNVNKVCIAKYLLMYMSRR
ncbi:HlyD family type I secretion periplasmic adaptor subunit [Alphaproteobacteria bacterium]|nr:HlyD family type I secretion periplasmic adaptor subunit [Alphaproteobacteria bacterium]